MSRRLRISLLSGLSVTAYTMRRGTKSGSRLPPTACSCRDGALSGLSRHTGGNAVRWLLDDLPGCLRAGMGGDLLAAKRNPAGPTARQSSRCAVRRSPALLIFTGSPKRYRLLAEPGHSQSISEAGHYTLASACRPGPRPSTAVRPRAGSWTESAARYARSMQAAAGSFLIHIEADSATTSGDAALQGPKGRGGWWRPMGLRPIHARLGTDYA